MMEQKKIRQTVRLRRQLLNPHEQHQAALQVLQHIQQHPKVLIAQKLALFLSCDHELDTRPLIEWLWSQNKQVYLPTVHPFTSNYLLFLRYQANSPLVKHRLGFKQPQLDVRDICPLAELDIIFTPLVAFDRLGNRIGMGGGYYDRTLQHWQHNACYPIGLAHDCQLVEFIPSQPWDIRLPEIITPSAIWCNDFVKSHSVIT